MKSEEAAIGNDISRMESRNNGSAIDVDLKQPGRDTELSRTYGQTQRGLKPRHVQLMAIGGSIGIGLWVCSSSHPLLTAIVGQ